MTDLTKTPVTVITGFLGAGKTTLARELEMTLPAVRFTLDAWMIRLYPELGIDCLSYGLRAETCKQLIWDSALGTLRADTDVVLDWNQWSRARRAEWATAARAAGFNVLLHHITAPLEIATERAARRAAEGTPGAHVLTAAGVRHLAGLFEDPNPDEGIPLILHNA